MHDAAQEVNIIDGQAESLALPEPETSPGVGERAVPGGQGNPHRIDSRGRHGTTLRLSARGGRTDRTGMGCAGSGHHRPPRS